jgi:hypothetical protein
MGLALGLFRSTDGGSTWAEVEAPVFDAMSIVHRSRG